MEHRAVDRAAAVLPSIKRKILGGSLWAFTGKAGAAVVYLGVSATLARFLVPADLGAFFFVLSVSSIAAVAGEMGLGRASIRILAGANEDQPATRALVWRITGLVMASGGVMALFASIVTAVLDPPFDVTLTTIVLLGVWMFCGTLARVLSELFRAFHDIRFASIFGLSFEGLAPGLLLLLWLAVAGSEDFEFLDALFAATCSLLTAIVAGSFLLWRIHLRKLPWTHRTTPSRGAVLSLALPMLVVTFSSIAFSGHLDVWLLGMFRPADDVAIFGAALRLVLLISMPLLVANGVLPPLIAQLSAAQEWKRLERVLRGFAGFSSMIAIVALLILGLWGTDLLVLLYGDYFAAAFPIMAVLAIGHAANVAAGSCGVTLLLSGHERLVMRVSLTVGVVSTVVSLLGVAFFGAMGIAIAAAARLVAQNAVLVVLVHRKLGIWTVPTLKFR